MSTLKLGKTLDYEHARETGHKKRKTELEAGDALREYLLDEFISGDLDNTQVARIAELHQRNGGTGLERLRESSSSHRKASVVKKYIEAIAQI
jgi:hypothetical protein|tara:strand:+ start:195 stop:473 length:279 start_codon:yes stop_codon:yes gene_type:complete